MAHNKDDLEFLRTRQAIAALGARTLGPDKTEMVSRLTSKDDRGRELGTSTHRMLAIHVAAGMAVVLFAELASKLAPDIDWIAVLSAPATETPDGKDHEHGTQATADSGHRDPG